MKQVNEYCHVNYNTLCGSNQLSFQQHIELLDAVSRYEQSVFLNKYNLKPLTEAEITDLRFKQNELGPIVYTIQLSDGNHEEMIYQGVYRKQVEMYIPRELIMQYSTITITSDYQKYPGKLASQKHTILNPYFALY